MLLCATTAWSQENHYFNKQKEYHFNALYIDSQGDTITEEKMVLKPLGKPWLFQPWLQESIRYIYHTDTAGYKNYVDTEKHFRERNKKHLAKIGELLLSSSEKTGVTTKKGVFFMHPPRTNQYRMLQYAAFPIVYFNALNDSTNHFDYKRKFIGMGGPIIQEYTVTPQADTLIEASIVKAWQIAASSSGDYNDYNESLHILDATLDATFTEEYGFVKLHYTFENDIKIQFDLEEVVRL
jgi:hypothetical protein